MPMIDMTIFLRFGLTFLLASFFGIERQRAHKPIGFGTFIFVSTGACALAISSINIAPENPMPLLGAIVTGIGFLGAGAMIKTTDRIFGVTTAASIWVFAIFGLVIGIGEYLIGIILYSMIWLIILYDRYLERKGIGSYQRKLIVITNKIIDEKEIKNLLLVNTKKHKIIALDINKNESNMSITYLIEGNKTEINKLPKSLYEKSWFASCKIE